MKFINRSTVRILPTFLVLPILFVATKGQAIAQQPSKPQADEVLRINTDLVQTAITVVDKNGRFVDGLDSAQFELTVDGKPRPVSFFERVTAGNAREEQLPVQSGANTNATKPANPPAPGATVRGRTIVFFIDDMHQSADSMHRTRDMLRHFLVNEMGSRDSVAIASASGQVGFLQQFTNNKEVLSAAIERLSPRQYEVRSYGTGSTQMREFDALSIDSGSSNKANNDVLNFYIRECVVLSNPPKQVAIARAAIAASCETQVRNSARAVLMQAGTLTLNMYAALESLMRSSARAPGRKLAFFISDGFLMDDGPHAPDLRAKLESIIDAAQRAGVVVYTIDSRGLINDTGDVRQGNARLDVGAPLGEVEAHQDAMNGLAADTGGRALRNTNYFDRWVGKVLDETSNYYLLAWRPQKDEEKTPKFRQVKISVIGRPELSVRAPRGYVEGPPPATETSVVATPEKPVENQKVKTPDAEISTALSDYYPSGALPTMLSLTFLNTPSNATVLTSSIQIASRGLNFGTDGKQPATITLAGVILNDKGKIASSFKNQLNVSPVNTAESDASGVIYNQHTPLPPGIYQVRVAARDEKSGHVGSAMQFVVIPDLATRQLTTSSVLLGGQLLENARSKDAGPQIQLSVDHRFARRSRLGYWIFVYNAKRDAAGAPNLIAQTQVVRDGQVMLSSPQRKLTQGGADPERIPFGDDFALQTLAPGSYDLRVTITDSIAGTSVTQMIDFVVV
jgi:VWFA-related protein